MIIPRRRYLLLILIMALASFAAGQEDTVSAETGTEAVKTADSNDEGPSFTLSVETGPADSGEGQAIYIVKARLEGAKALWKRVEQVDLWWTSPTGSRTRFELKPFGDGLWVSRLAAVSEPGLHDLSLVALLSVAIAEDGTVGEPGVGEVCEVDYQLDVPSLQLTLTKRRLMTGEGGESPVLDDMAIAGQDGSSTTSGASIVLITLMIGLTNILLLALLAGARLMISHLPRAIRKFRVDADQAQPVSQTLHDIFAQGRLFDEYEEPGVIVEPEAAENKLSPGGKLKGLFDKVLAKDAKDEPETADASPSGDSDEEMQINHNDLSF